MGRKPDPNKRTENPDYTRISLFMRKDLVKRLKINAIQTDRDPVEVQEAALEEYLKRNGG